MKTNVLMAVLAGLMGGAVDPRSFPIERRTAKVRPTNYIHPMIGSSPAEIAAWNRDVTKKKAARTTARFKTRSELAHEIISAGVDVQFYSTKGMTAGLRKLARSSTYGTGVGHVTRSAA